MELSDAPNRYSIGLPASPIMTVRTKPVIISSRNEVLSMRSALSLSFAPLAMENKGAPPLPYRLVNAVMSVIIGKHKPIPPRAIVPSPGMRPM